MASSVLFRVWNKVSVFVLPTAVLSLIAAGLFGASYSYTIAIALGIVVILKNAYEEISEGRYALDYVAFLAMVVALLTDQELAGAIVTLMFTGGEALEDFASRRAEGALKALSDTIPKQALVNVDGRYVATALQDIREGQRILVKRNELVPLDGTLTSAAGSFDMSNLTGEAVTVEIREGVLVKSGAVNVGDTIELMVVGDFSSSTYHRIVELVEKAKSQPARFVRLSAQVSLYFTGFTIFFAALAYMIGGSTSLLAVLVVATPCPLIIAAPVAFLSGMSRLAKRKVIVRDPTALELLDRINVIFFDKTGTLTFGEPKLVSIEKISERGRSSSDEELLAIAAGLEIHSLHPLARAIVREANVRNVAFETSTLVSEKIGEGISGHIAGRSYNITGRESGRGGITLVLSEAGKTLAEFHFLDTLKTGVAGFLQNLKAQGITTEVITGDTKESANQVFGDIDIKIHAGASPEDKYRMVEAIHQEGKIVAMVGDGLNDAPALARADVGVVFSGAENAASINAADIVMLDSRIEHLDGLLSASRRTLMIARESVYVGAGLSVCAMGFAAFGLITPVMGALIQEAIDVAVILNALRALR